MNYRVIYSGELYHHGILGQKWGKRNGPPYPLDVEDHSQREKKAGWRKSLDKGPNSESKKSGLQLTDKQKKMLKIGAAVAVTGLAAYGLYRLGATGAIGEIAEQTTNAAKEIIEGSKEDILSTVDKSSWKDVKSQVERLKNLYEEGRVYSGGKSYEEDLKIKELAHEYNTKNLFSKVQYDLMSKDEQGSLNFYTTQYYKQINEALRNNTESDDPLVKIAAKNLENALEKTALPKDVYIHRGVGFDLDDVGKMLGCSKETLMEQDMTKLKSQLVGHTFVEKAFASCGGAEPDAWRGVKLHINVPKGAKGMYIAPISAKEAEHEFLLQRGSEFIINGVKRDRAGTLEFYISLIDQK